MRQRVYDLLAGRPAAREDRLWPEGNTRARGRRGGREAGRPVPVLAISPRRCSGLRCTYRIVIASEAWPKIVCSACMDPPRIMNQLAKWWRQSWKTEQSVAVNQMLEPGWGSGDRTRRKW